MLLKLILKIDFSANKCKFTKLYWVDEDYFNKHVYLTILKMDSKYFLSKAFDAMNVY